MRIGIAALAVVISMTVSAEARAEHGGVEDYLLGGLAIGVIAVDAGYLVHDWSLDSRGRRLGASAARWEIGLAAPQALGVGIALLFVDTAHEDGNRWSWPLMGVPLGMLAHGVSTLLTDDVPGGAYINGIARNAPTTLLGVTALVVGRDNDRHATVVIGTAVSAGFLGLSVARYLMTSSDDSTADQVATTPFFVADDGAMVPGLSVLGRF